MRIAICVFFLLSVSFSSGQITQPCSNPGVTCSTGANKDGNLPTFLNGNGVLGLTYSNTACGLNYVQRSVMIQRRSAGYSFNTNGTGLPSSVNIAGLPAGYILDKAYLWFTSSYYSAAPPVPTVTITNPAATSNIYPAALIGRDGTKCWTGVGEKGTAVYRTDVSSNISGNGIYNFNITGFTNGSNEIDGATLMIIYRNPSVTYKGTLVIWDGAMTSSGTPSTKGVNMTGIPLACANATYANAFLVVSDMQSNVNGGTHSSTLNGTSYSFPNSFYNFDLANTTFTAGQTSCNSFANGGGSDCFCVSLEGLYYQTNCTMALNATPSSPACGLCNGSATVNVTGGTTPYVYSWSPSGQTTQAATGLCAGNYSVTVSDNGGCTYSTTSVTLTGSVSTLTANISSSINPTCAGSCSGSAVAAQTGGTAPYTYLWTPSGQTTLTAVGLCAGTYTVLVNDSGNCSSPATIIISDPPLLTSLIANTNVLCNGGNTGSASVTASGGSGSYSYLWSNADTATTTSTLSAGTYSVTVTDANNCTSTQNIIITEPLALTTTFSQTNVSCNGVNDGSATITASGGSGNYTYLWSNADTAATASSLSSGTYSVTVADANNCTSTQNIIITEPSALMTSSSQTNVSCNGANDGSTTITASGGSGNYTYLWSNADTAATASSLSAGAYSVTVTDANNCTSTQNIIITEPSALMTFSSQTNVSCNGANDGSATITASGGSGNYTYLWSNAGTSTTASSLSAGTYSVTVTDANNCTSTQNIIITEPSALMTSSSQTNVSCNGANDGNAAITASGGTGPYFYLWNTVPIQTTQTATGLFANTYLYVVADANNCTSSMSITITQPLPVTLNTSATQTMCSPPSGTASASAVGGTSPYSYLWNDGQITATATGLGTGTYTVTVTDINNCAQIASAIVTQVSGIIAGIQNSSNVLCNSQCNGSASASVTGGLSPYSYSWSDGQANISATGLCAGTYDITITDANNCISTSSIVITEPALLTTTIPPVNTICISQNASVNVNVTGGTPNYNFTWSSGQVINPISVSPSITTYYSVTVTDQNGCADTVSVTVNVNTPLSVTTTTGAPACSGQSTTVSANVTGGNGGPYTYSWLPSVGLGCSTCQNTSANPPSSVTYTVTVSDNCGTPFATNSATAVINPLPPVNVSSNTSICSGASTQITSTVNPGYSYSWIPATGLNDPTRSDPTASPTIATTYVLIVTDLNGCTGTDALTINIDPLPNAIAGPSADICNGETTQLNASGGFIYSWSPAAGLSNPFISNPTAFPTLTTTYTVTVSLGNQCLPGTDTLTVNVHPAPPLFTIADTTIMVGSNVNLTTIGGGITYEWFPSTGLSCNTCISPLASPSKTTTYIVTTTDVYGCKNQDTVLVNVEDMITLYIPNAFSPSSDNESNNIFYAYGVGITEFEFYIFNRWGDLIFQSTDPSIGWNGTYKGQLVQQDVYVYLAKARSLTGQSISKTGSVTVVK